MAREKFQTLTEQMFYVLLTLREECCGTDVMARISNLTQGRVTVGPGTLYNLLSGRRLDHGDENRRPQAELSHHPRRGTGLG